MKIPFFTKLKIYLRESKRWFFKTPERALEQAYKAALMIKTIEEEHFGGEKISASQMQYSDSAMSYFMADLEKYLNTAKLRLAEFKASRSVMSMYDQNLLKYSIRENQNPSGALESSEKSSILIENLKSIDNIIEKYNDDNKSNSSLSLVPVVKPNIVIDDNPIQQNSVYQITSSTKSTVGADTLSDKTGALPRSIGRTFERIQQNFDPKAEEQILQSFRNYRKKTLSSVQFILLLIIVPILTQQVSKNLLFGPIVDQIRNQEKTAIFLYVDFDEEAFRELQIFEEQLKFKSLTGLDPELSKEEREEQLKHKASEIAKEYREQSADAIKNVFADIMALIAFCLTLVIGKQQLQIIKDFTNEVAYSLSDSAKAFMIILFTDMFVGFHSPHGWEVILQGLLKHLGLQENKSFISLFIATFPVILDTIFKYWIFRYLSRMSPSAVATYKNMNE